MGQMHHISEEDMLLLTEVLDGALPPQDATVVQQRIATDPALREAFQDLTCIRAELTHLPALESPRSLRLDATTFQHARGWRWWLRLPPAGVLTPALSVVASMVVGLFFLQRLLQPVAPPIVEMQMMADAPVMSEAAPMMRKEAPMAPESQMSEMQPANQADAMATDNAPMSAALAPEPPLMLPDEPLPAMDMEYQQDDVVWFDWMRIGAALSALLCAISLGWLIRVWWRIRSQRVL